MLSKQEAIRLATAIHGWCTEVELEWLYDAARCVPVGGTWVEVGCWKGRSLAAVAFGLPPMKYQDSLGGGRCELIPVDTFRGNTQSLTHFEVRFGDWVRGHVDLLGKLLKHERPDIIVRPPAVMSAARFAWERIDISIDAVHLDPDYRDSRDNPAGAHEAAVADIEAWLPKIKPGGLLCGRNCCDLFPGVRRAVEECLGSVSMIEVERPRDVPNYLWFWRKP